MCIHLSYDLDFVKTTLSSRLCASQASANITFTLVCAMSQAPLPECVHPRVNLLPLILLSFCEYPAPSKVFFSNSDKNGVFKTLVHLWVCCPGLSLEIQVSWRYRLSRRSSDRCLLAHWRSFAALSSGGLFGDGALRRSFNSANVLLSCSSD